MVGFVGNKTEIKFNNSSYSGCKRHPPPLPRTKHIDIAEKKPAKLIKYYAIMALTGQVI